MWYMYINVMLYDVKSCRAIRRITRYCIHFNHVLHYVQLGTKIGVLRISEVFNQQNQYVNSDMQRVILNNIIGTFGSYVITKGREYFNTFSVGL